MTDTVREIAVQALRDAFNTMVDGAPVDDPYTVTWDRIERYEIDEEVGRKKQYVLSILEGNETKVHRTRPLVQADLEIALEFIVRIAKTDTAASTLNRVLGELLRKIGENTTLGGTVVDIKDTGNEFQIVGMDDKLAKGVLFITLKYRHDALDPRIAI